MVGNRALSLKGSPEAYKREVSTIIFVYKCSLEIINAIHVYCAHIHVYDTLLMTRLTDYTAYPELHMCSRRVNNISKAAKLTS